VELAARPIGPWASAKYDREIELNGDLDVNLSSMTLGAGADLRRRPTGARGDTLKVADLQAPFAYACWPAGSRCRA
jgi:hypothetical protein